MRILHTGDIHLGELAGPVTDGENARMMDMVRCMSYLDQKAREENVDAILICGDLFHKSKLWADQMLKEIGIAAKWLRSLSLTAPTVLMFGTRNHDNEQAFENIRAMHIPNLYVVTTPELLTLRTKSGPLQVAAVPGYDKGYFRAKFPGMSAEEENLRCSQLLGDIILGLGAQLDPNIPSVLMSHYTVIGCQLDNGEHVFLQSDVVLPKESLAASPFDLVTLGHIHRAQKVDGCDRPVFYSGPLNGITFNEECQEKGFWIHEMAEEPVELGKTNYGRHKQSLFIATPYRDFSTVVLNEDWVRRVIENAGETVNTWPWIIKDRIVRVHYSCSDEVNKQLNRKALEKTLYEAGAFYVAEITPKQIVTALSKQELTENAGPAVNLIQWLAKQDCPEEETQAIVALAQPLIDMVSAKMPTGKLSGMFVPKRIEVKNYRSYREEAFEFNQVSFATVNGPNGVGKSALFMDAICDCLYEEPREGDLTGWIANDGSVRSGAITFEFSMGDTDWRVTRTRAKSGKTTLALAELVNGEWVDRSCDKVRETQEKIIALLGMDAQTFRCCAMIMQDAYGLFMEADKEDRMQVLANILGLNIYEQLTDLAKAKVTDTNRELSKARDKLAELDQRLNVKAGLDAELAEVNSSLTVVAHNIAEKEAALKEAEELVRQLTARKERVEELQKQIVALTIEIQDKEQEKNKCREQLKWAEERISREDIILAKAAEYEQVREQVTTLKAKQPQLGQMTVERRGIADELDAAEINIKKLDEQIGVIKRQLEKREQLQQEAEEYKTAVKLLEKSDKVALQYQDLANQFTQAEKTATEKFNELTQLGIKLQQLNSKVTMLDNSNCIDPENAKCSFLADAQKAKADVPEVSADIDRIREEHRQLQSKVIELKSQIEELYYNSETHAQLRLKVNRLRTSAELYAELSSKEELLNTLENQRKQSIETKYRLLEKQQVIDQQINTFMEELRPLAEMEARLPKLEAWLKAKDELPVAKQIKESVSERIVVLDGEINVKDAQRKQLDSEKADMLIAASSLQTHKDDVDILSRQIKSFQEKQNELLGKAGGLKAKLEALQKDQEERDRIAREMEPTAKLLVQYQTLAKAFGFDGIPFSIVRAVVPELSGMANEILGQMTGGKMCMEMRTERIQKSNKKEVNALEIWITDYQRGTLPYKSRSGGQKVKSALSVAFALADLKARRAGIQLGMLFIDEPPFLDGEGTEAYCDALELVSQRYPDMIVLAISHDPRMKARFPQQIDVFDSGDGSKVRLVA